MKTVILAGGLGTRLGEETARRPKPMVEIGDRPILWHIMRYYSAAGFNDFVVALGYRGEVVKRYFLDTLQMHGHLRVDLRARTAEPSREDLPPWRVDLVETGAATQIAGRIKRAKPWVGEGTFMLTYGDGVSNVDLAKLIAFHKSHGKLATMTAVRAPSAYGALVFENDRITEFHEKPAEGAEWINGGFFVLEPEMLSYIAGDDTMWEDVLGRLAADGELAGFKHHGFFQPMDTIRDREVLQRLWASGKAPWKV